MEPLINILIRNKYRPELLRRTLRSIGEQEYPNVNIIACSDSDEAFTDFNKAAAEAGLKFVQMRVYPTAEPYYWNLYCNTLKSEVTAGWFFYLDNDDYLRPGCLKDLARHLTDKNTGIICQFQRGKMVKPNRHLVKFKRVVKGLIGGSCIILHHTKKNIADWETGRAADFRYIKAVEAKMPLRFIPVLVAIAGNGGLHGK